jgi:anti-sigma factor RsiW
LDENLTVDEMRKLAAHLETCRSCESELMRLQKTKNLLQGLASPRPRADFWSETYEQLQRESMKPLPWWKRLSVAQRSAMVIGPALVSATLAALLAFQPSANTPPPPRFDSMNDLIQAHLEAKSAQPFTDQSHVHMLLVSAQDNDDLSGE